MKSKQQSLDSLHGTLRTTSSELGEATHLLEDLETRFRTQQLARQQVTNLARAKEDEQYHLMGLERSHGRMDIASAASWEAEADAAANAAGTGANIDMLPSVAVLRARISAVRSQTEEMRRAEMGLKGRSREQELKFRRLVALATRCTDAEVDARLEGLMRAVESEKGELEIGRVRRFLGGVEGVVR
jgi:regulatory protein SWI6